MTGAAVCPLRSAHYEVERDVNGCEKDQCPERPGTIERHPGAEREMPQGREHEAEQNAPIGMATANAIGQ